MNVTEPPDEAFTAVLDGLTLGGRRHRRSESIVDVHPPVDVARSGAIPSTQDKGMECAGPEPAGDASIVRPYSWTRGRTRSTVDLRIEALVTTTERGDDVEAMAHSEHRAVADLCREPRSVAEIAALLGVPLGVAKVLLGDMANFGLVVVHETALGGANKAHLLLMERVLSGLRRL